MDLNFTKVTFDEELDDLSEDKLRDLVSEYMNAQESNVAEFNEAADKLDEIGDIDYDEYEDARADLIGDITEAESFDAVPVTEDELEAADFGKVREWHDYVTEQDIDDEGEDDGEFDDFGDDPDIDDPDGQNFNDDLVEVVDGLSGVNVEQQ